MDNTEKILALLEKKRFIERAQQLEHRYDFFDQFLILNEQLIRLIVEEVIINVFKKYNLNLKEIQDVKRKIWDIAREQARII